MGGKCKARADFTHACEQMWHLLNDQIRATEGFRFQGMQPIRDHVDITLSDLSVSPPANGSPLLKGVLSFEHALANSQQ